MHQQQGVKQANTADITEQQFRQKAQDQQDFDLILRVESASSSLMEASKSSLRTGELLYEFENAESFLQFCSFRHKNLMVEEDYRPLSDLSRGHLEHFPLSFQYQIKSGHFRKAFGAGTLSETSFGQTYTLLILSAEQITSDLVGKDKTGVLCMHEFFEAAFRQAENRQSFPKVRTFCPVSLDLTSLKEYNRLYGMQRGDLCLKKIWETITACFPGALIGSCCQRISFCLF